MPARRAARDPATTLHKRPAATPPTRRRRRSRQRTTPARVAAAPAKATTPTQHRRRPDQYAGAAREYDDRSPRKLVKTLYSRAPSSEHYRQTTPSRSRRLYGDAEKPMRNASRCAGVRCAARAAAAAHASHAQARRIIPRALRVTLAAVCGVWLVVCSSGGARASDQFCRTRPLIRR